MGGALIMGISSGLNFYGFSTFFAALSTEFGWSRAILSGVFALSRLEGGVLGPVEGLLIDKLGARKMMLVGITLMGIGFILLSRVHTILSLYMVYILGISFGAGLGSFAPVTATVANWFVKKRTRALGIVMSSNGLGGAALLPVLGWWVATYGWRNAAVWSGLLVLALGLPVALLMRHKPQQYGYLPDGAIPLNDKGSTIGEPETADGKSSVDEEFEFGPIQSLKTSAFWFLSLANALRAMVTTGFTLHFVVMMVERGFSLPVASSMLGAVALLSGLGRLGVAWIGDMVNKKNLLFAATVVVTVAMLGFSQAQSNLALYMLIVIYSIAYGGTIVLPVALQADYFGTRAFATIRGLQQAVATVGLFIGPIFGGVVYDITGTYSIAFLGFAAAGFLSMLLVLGIRRPTIPHALPLNVLEA